MKRTWMNYLIELLFPNRCPGCDAILYPGELVCESCGERMILPHDAVCHTCGKVLCVCKKRSFSYDRAVVACRYRDETVSAIVSMKRSRNTNFARFSARILADRIRYSLNYGTFDCVVPVPMHPSKQRRRGYNQAELIAEEMASLLEIPCRNDILCKDNNRQEQHKLNAEERMRNVSSFGIHDIPLDGMRILLCDDVLTTGSTMNRCAALLKQNGAEAVVIAAAATTVPMLKPPLTKEETQ